MSQQVHATYLKHNPWKNAWQDAMYQNCILFLHHSDVYAVVIANYQTWLGSVREQGMLKARYWLMWASFCAIRVFQRSVTIWLGECMWASASWKASWKCLDALCQILGSSRNLMRIKRVLRSSSSSQEATATLPPGYYYYAHGASFQLCA